MEQNTNFVAETVDNAETRVSTEESAGGSSILIQLTILGAGAAVGWLGHKLATRKKNEGDDGAETKKHKFWVRKKGKKTEQEAEITETDSEDEE